MTAGVVDDSGVRTCQELDDFQVASCHELVYRTSSTSSSSSSVPSDSQPDLYLYTSELARGFYLACGSIIVLLNVYYIYFYTKHSDSKAIKNSQIKLLYVISLASVVGALRIFVSSADVNISSCSAKLWLEHFAFQLMFGTLALKLWRIDRIVNGTAMKRVKITEEDILRILIVDVIFFSLILALIQGLGNTQVCYVVYLSTLHIVIIYRLRL